MVIKKFHARCDIRTQFKTHRAILRDGSLGIGPEGYADFHDVTLANTQGGMRKKIEQQASMAHDNCVARDSSAETTDSSQKRSAFSPPPVQRESKKSKQCDQIDQADGCEIISRANSTTLLKDLRASTITLDDPKATPEQTGTTTRADATDSDDCMILDVKETSPAVKRKMSTTSEAGSTKKRPKQTEDPEDASEAEAPVVKRPASVLTKSSGKSSATPGKQRKRTKDDDDESEPETPSVKRPAVASTSSRGKATKPSQKRQQQVTESEDEEEVSEESAADEGSGSENEDEEDEDPGALRQKLAEANKELNKSCRTCKTNANRALKTKYETEIRQLKSKSKKELSDAKAKATKDLRAVKSKADEDKDDQKIKHENRIKDLKTNRADKVASLTKKLEALQENYDEMKSKLEDANKKVTKERDEAEAKRKQVEKSANEKVRDMKADIKAEQVKLNEQSKQLKRETAAEINELKPDHSKALKTKEKVIKDLTERAHTLQTELQETESELSLTRQNASADRQRLLNSQANADRAYRQYELVKNNLREFETYTTKVEGKCGADVARVEEKLEVERGNVKQHSVRLADQMRLNNHLRETLRKQTALGREKDGRIEGLETEVKALREEVGVGRVLEGMVEGDG